MAGAFLSILLLMVARHHPPSRRKIKEIWHGRVHWEQESNTTMLRSVFSQTDNKKEAKPTEITKPTEEATTITPFEKQNIVIVIPYRDRAVHYKKIMQHLPSITRENWSIHTILVEQYDKDPFRRAWLMNIGISEAKKRFKDDNTCVVTHDVDMIADSKVDYGWCDRPTQICSELSCFNGGVPYATSGGGVVQASLKDWYAINGFTNGATGWGGEDDDLHHRFRVNNLLSGGHLRRPVKGFGKCHCMHDKDHTKRVRDPKGYSDIVAKIGRMKRGSGEWKTDGLNSLKFHVSEESVDKYGTIHLKVEVVKTIINEKVGVDGNKVSEQNNPKLYPKRRQCCKPDNKRCDWVKTSTTIPECEKQNLLQLLRWLKKTLKNIEWRLDSGTLLGAIRERGHIQHETDIDIAVSLDDWEKMARAIQARINSTHFTFKDTKYPSRLFFSHTNKVHVDIWPYKRYKTTSNLWQSAPKTTWVSVANDKLYPFKECEYENDTYPCPRDSKWILSTKYGTKWNIPLVKYGPKSKFKDGQGNSWVPMPKHSCPASETKKYKILSELVHALDEVDCPYNIHAGTLLGFVRDCTINDNDIDIVIPIVWRRKNEARLTKSLEKYGFKKYFENAFGTIDKFGYETSRKKNGIKIDLFSYVDEPSRYIWGLWKSGKVYKCPAYRKTIGTAMWGDLQVRVPIPYDTVLTSWYGKGWKKPFKGKWRWFQDAFEVGSCIK